MAMPTVKLLQHKFATRFEANCSPLSTDRNAELRANYKERRSINQGSSISHSQQFDAELMSKLVDGLALGKAAAACGYR